MNDFEQTGSIFEATAHAVIDQVAACHMKQTAGSDVLYCLVVELQKSGWYTTTDLWKKFADHPVVMNVFRKMIDMPSDENRSSGGGDAYVDRRIVAAFRKIIGELSAKHDSHRNLRSDLIDALLGVTIALEKSA